MNKWQQLELIVRSVVRQELALATARVIATPAGTSNHLMKEIAEAYRNSEAWRVKHGQQPEA